MRYAFLLSFFSFSSLFSQLQIGSVITDTLENSSIGRSVSINRDGSVIAISSLGLNRKGLVKVYEKKLGEWYQIGETIYGDFNFEEFGNIVSLSDDGYTIAIGSMIKGISSSYEKIGAVKVYNYSNNKWVQKGLALNGIHNGALFGAKVKISGDGSTIIVASFGLIKDNKSLGGVYVFNFVGNNWQQKGNIIWGLSGYSLSSISISKNANRIVIGESESLTTEQKGIVRVFEFKDNDYVQLGSEILGSEKYESLGHSVDITANGNIIAIGSPGANNYKGKVCVYKFENNEWVQMGNQILGKKLFGNLGGNVSISENGDKIMCGEYVSSSNKIGYLEVNSFDANIWLNLDYTFRNLSIDDLRGYSFQLSKDGSHVVIGHPAYNVSNKNNLGGVIVYKLSSSNLSLNNFKNIKKISIYPNPSISEITIKLNEIINAPICIFDICGKLVKDVKSSNELTQNINISDLKAGIYLIKIENQTLKFIKE